MASQVENPLNDLFGKKGNTDGMKSLLGTLGDVPRSKGNSVSSYQGRGVVKFDCSIKDPHLQSWRKFLLSREGGEKNLGHQIIWDIFILGHLKGWGEVKF